MELSRQFALFSDNMIQYILCTIIFFPYFVVCFHRYSLNEDKGLFSSLQSFHSERWLSCGRLNNSQISILLFVDSWNCQFILSSVLNTRWITDTLILWWSGQKLGVRDMQCLSSFFFLLEFPFRDFLFRYEVLVEKALFTRIIRKSSSSSPHSYQQCLAFHCYVINCIIVVAMNFLLS